MSCQLCGLDVTATYLATHLEVQHDVRHMYVREEICHPAPRSFVARAAPGVGLWHCPVPGCPAVPCTANNLWQHFAFRHPQDMVRINGRKPMRCGVCGIQTAKVNSHHLASAKCRNMAAMRRRHQVAGEAAAAARQRFQAYEGDPRRSAKLRCMETFKYLGRVISNDDCDTPAIRRNLKRARTARGSTYRR